MSSEILQRIPVAVPIARRAAQLAFERGIAPLYFGVDIERDLGRSVIADPRVPLVPSYLERNAHRICYADILDHLFTAEPTTVEFFGSRDEVFSLDAALSDELGASAAVYTGHLPRYDSWLVGLNGAGVSKASAAEFLCRLLHVEREETLAIGDQSNDIELLKWAGFGVCMQNGSASARAAADHVTGSLADDGVAQVIEEFLLQSA